METILFFLKNFNSRLIESLGVEHDTNRHETIKKSRRAHATNAAPNFENSFCQYRLSFQGEYSGRKCDLRWGLENKNEELYSSRKEVILFKKDRSHPVAWV